MNKTQLISKVAEMSGLTKAQAQNAVNCVLDATIDELKKGEKVLLPGFGTFTVVERQARTAKAFGKTIEIPATKAIKFKAGKLFEN